MTPRHHNAKASSDRIQRVLRALSQAGSTGITTIQINELCNSTRASSDVSEARAATGLVLPCRYDGLGTTGRRVYRYFIG